jgi:hypothetical protein
MEAPNRVSKVGTRPGYSGQYQKFELGPLTKIRGAVLPGSDSSARAFLFGHPASTPRMSV